MGAFNPMFERWNLPRWLRPPQSGGIEPAPELASETAATVNPVGIQNEDRRTHSAGAPALAGETAKDDIAGQLARIWEKLLRIESVGMDENYFDLGGDSSLTIQLFVQIEKKFGVQLPIVTLFESPTVCELANAIRRAKPGARRAFTSSEDGCNIG